MALLSNNTRRGRSRWWILLGLILLPPATVIGATSQQEVQAVYLLNLTRFVRWPESAFAAEDAALVIGVLPEESVGALLDNAAKGELAGRHPIVVRRIRTSADLDGCHLVFFSKASMANVTQMVGVLRARPVLMVSDADGFLRLGGHVQMYNRAGQVRLRLDLGNLKRAELAASAPLLRVVEVTGN